MIGQVLGGALGGLIALAIWIPVRIVLDRWFPR